jgi:hypothetical protein
MLPSPNGLPTTEIDRLGVSDPKSTVFRTFTCFDRCQSTTLNFVTRALRRIPTRRNKDADERVTHTRGLRKSNTTSDDIRRIAGVFDPQSCSRPDVRADLVRSRPVPPEHFALRVGGYEPSERHIPVFVGGRCAVLWCPRSSVRVRTHDGISLAPNGSGRQSMQLLGPEVRNTCPGVQCLRPDGPGGDKTRTRLC